MNEAMNNEGRMKATDVLRDRASMLMRRANGLKQLADQLDLIAESAASKDGGEDGPHVGVGSQAEEALWEMACSIR